jgi:hypothetical protein
MLSSGSLDPLENERGRSRPENYVAGVLSDLWFRQQRVPTERIAHRWVGPFLPRVSPTNRAPLHSKCSSMITSRRPRLQHGRDLRTNGFTTNVSRRCRPMLVRQDVLPSVQQIGGSKAASRSCSTASLTRCISGHGEAHKQVYR